MAHAQEPSGVTRSALRVGRRALRGATHWLYAHVPALESLRTYTRGKFVADLLAGLTVASIAVPQAMAYAILAGLPPQYGIYTAIVVTTVGALFDSSHQLINGPTNAISVALLTALAVVPEGSRVDAAILFAFLVGAVQLGITVLRLGDLSRFVSHAVIVGFTLGASMLIVLDQFKHLVGLPSAGSAGDHFLKRFWLSLTSGHPWHAPTLLVGVSTVVMVVSVRWFNGWMRQRGVRFPVPQHLVAVVFMAVLVWALDLRRHGIQVVGAIPDALPSFETPPWRWDWVQQFLGNAFGVAILGLLEAVAMAKAIAARTGQKLDIHKQCLSEGLANLAGSFFQCMPGSGSLTRSTVNMQAGAVSQWSGVFSAIGVAVAALILSPLVEFIRAALAGLVILAAFRMVDTKQLVFHLRATRFDALIVIATALAAVFVSVEFCIMIGVFLSFVLYVPRAAQVQLSRLVVTADHGLSEHDADNAVSGPILAYQFEGDLSFGAAAELDRHLRHIEEMIQPDTRAVLLSLKRARNADAAFLGLIKEFHIRLKRRRVTLILSGVRPDLMRGLRATRLETTLGPEHVIADTAHGSAVAGILRALSKQDEVDAAIV